MKNSAQEAPTSQLYRTFPNFLTRREHPACHDLRYHKPMTARIRKVAQLRYVGRRTNV